MPTSPSFLRADAGASPIGALSSSAGTAPFLSRNRGIALSAAAVGIAFLVGGATSFGQLIPGTLNWLANSVTAWSIAMALLVWFARGRVLRSALTGALTFVAMAVGYAVVSTLRGFPDTPERWAMVGLVVGPVLGAATALLRSRDRRVVALSGGILAGIAPGDGVRGLLAVPDGWGTWTLFLVVGAALVGWLAATRLRSAGTIAMLVGAAVVVGGAYVLVTDVLLGAVFH